MALFCHTLPVETGENNRLATLTESRNLPEDSDTKPAPSPLRPHRFSRVYSVEWFGFGGGTSSAGVLIIATLRRFAGAIHPRSLAKRLN